MSKDANFYKEKYKTFKIWKKSKTGCPTYVLYFLGFVKYPKNVIPKINNFHTTEAPYLTD